MKRIVSLILCGALLLGCAVSRAATEGYAFVMTDELAGRVKLMDAPSENAEVLAELYAGTSVIPTAASQNGWTPVTLGQQPGGTLSGYVKCALLSTDSHSLGFSFPVLAVHNTTGGDGITLRAEPSTESRELAMYQNGAQVMVLAVLKDWYFVQVGGLTGLMARYGFADDLGPADTQPATDGALIFDTESNTLDFGTVVGSVTETSKGVFTFDCQVGYAGGGDRIQSVLVYANRELVATLPCVHTNADGSADGFSLSDVSIDWSPYAFEFYPQWQQGGLGGECICHLFSAAYGVIR